MQRSRACSWTLRSRTSEAQHKQLQRTCRRAVSHTPMVVILLMGSPMHDCCPVPRRKHWPKSWQWRRT